MEDSNIMKKFIAAASLAACLAFPCVSNAQQPPAAPPSPATATASTVKVGIIDLNRIIEEHPVSVQWDKDLNDKKAAREEEVKTEIRNKFGVTDETQLTDEQKDQVQQYISIENEKFRQEMLPERNANLQKVEDDIITFTAIVAKDKGLDLVVDRVAVIYGGEDVTDAVLDLINKKQP